MCHRQCFGFRNVQFFGEYLRESVNKEGLSACLFVNGFNHFWSKSLSSFISILSKEFLYLSKRKIEQGKIVMDIERRGRAIGVELLNAFNANDAETVGGSGNGSGDVDAAEGI